MFWLYVGEHYLAEILADKDHLYNATKTVPELRLCSAQMPQMKTNSDLLP
jgi:hypothetical protein